MDKARRDFLLSGFLLSAIALSYLVPQGTIGAAEVKREKAPSFVLKLFDGGELKSSDLRGKLVVLKFMASW